MYLLLSRLLYLQPPGRKQILVLVAFVLSMASMAYPQSAPSAYRGPNSIWVGAEYSNIDTSFPYQSGSRLSGAGAFVDFNFHGRIGIEADARFLHFGGFHGETESSYLAGPRYLFPQWRHLQPYAKALIGLGRIHYPFQIGDASYFAIAPGGGINYRLNHRWTLRAEYEYQIWPNSPGYSSEPDHKLTPNGFHLGIAYRLFR